MTSERLNRIFSIIFVLGFFAYLFGPLIVMSMTAFNSSAFPRIAPWECFSVEWFDVLMKDKDLMTGLQNSIIIAFGVILLAVPLGLAGALMLTQVSNRYRPWYYTIVISPILIPGVVLGISTLVFWDRMGRMFNASYDSFFYDGIFLTIMGQTTFVAAYAMLIFISRLQRFDYVQEEAALDLGATHVQTFRKILLPFLKPAIGSAAVLGFLASFENYNTTVFTIVSESTLTTVLASKVRYGINPSISALAVIIIALTLFGAVVYEILKRREEKYNTEVRHLADKGSNDRAKRASLMASPALILVMLITIAGIGTIYMAGTMGVDECKVAVKEQKRLETERKIREFKAKRMFQSAQPAVGDQAPVRTAPAEKPQTSYDSLFAPSNLEGQVKPGSEAAPQNNGSSLFAPVAPTTPDTTTEDSNNGGSLFAPVAPVSPQQKQDESSENNSYNNLFTPQNLKSSD